MIQYRSKKFSMVKIDLADDFNNSSAIGSQLASYAETAPITSGQPTLAAGVVLKGL